MSLEAVVFYTQPVGAELLARMPSYRTHSAAAGPTPRIVVALLATLLTCLLAGPVRADVALYLGVVPLRGTTDADRNAAFGDALKAAAVRATGRRDAGSDPRIVSAAADPSRYIQQYSTTADRMLKVGFDGRSWSNCCSRRACRCGRSSDRW